MFSRRSETSWKYEINFCNKIIKSLYVINVLIMIKLDPDLGLIISYLRQINTLMVWLCSVFSVYWTERKSRNSSSVSNSSSIFWKRELFLHLFQCYTHTQNQKESIHQGFTLLYSSSKIRTITYKKLNINMIYTCMLSQLSLKGIDRW